MSAAVERHHLDAGHLLWGTPRIRDFGGWLRDRHEHRLLADEGLPRCLSELEAGALWRGVIQDSDRSGDFPDPAAAARAARRARRAAYDHCIPLAAIAASDSEEARVLVEWLRAFDERCRALGVISVEELPDTFDAAPAPVSWLESPSWRPAARRWLERHGGGMLRPAAAPAPAQTRVVHAVSPAAELAAAADWARAHLEADPRFRAWICVPDLAARRPDCVDAFDAALAPRRFSLRGGESVAPYAVAGGTALAEHAPVRAALDLLAASASPLSFERFSALLRSAEWHATEAEAVSAAVLDVALRRGAPSEASLEAWLALCESLGAANKLAPVAALARLRTAHDSLRRPGSHRLSGWVPIWVRAFDAGPWAQRHRWSSADYQAAERLRSLLGDLASADPFFGAQTRADAERILATTAREVAFQAQTGITPIWISGQVTDPWLHYDGIWITGIAEEVWPPAADPVPLLPVRLQRDYGVVAASADLQLRLARDLQARWQARAGRLLYSLANSSDFRASSPSPLLEQARPPLPAGAAPYPHWRPFVAASPGLERLSDEVAPAFDAGERTRGIATLRAQSRCAFRGFAETRLAADRLELPTPGFSDRERGTLVHLALEHVWSALRHSAALAEIAPEALAELLHTSVLRAIAAVSAGRDPGPRWRAREQRRLASLIAKWLDVERRRPPFEVERLEQGKQAARHAGLDFMVRIDRIDRLADGARVLIDYKSGMALPDWRGERPDNPQLPIYALLRREGLVAVAYGQVNAGGCRFIAEAERPSVFKAGAPRTRLEGCASFAELLEVWSQRIDTLAGDFAGGYARVAPTPQACRSCHLQGLCRVPPALAGRGEE